MGWSCGARLPCGLAGEGGRGALLRNEPHAADPNGGHLLQSAQARDVIARETVFTGGLGRRQVAGKQGLVRLHRRNCFPALLGQARRDAGRLGVEVAAVVTETVSGVVEAKSALCRCVCFEERQS
jgi:hypothetical protein